MGLHEEIGKFFEGDIENSPETLENYSKDASLFYLKPSLVVFPKNTQDIKNLVAFVSQAKKDGRNISLTARSAGTDMTGGPLTESVVVEMTRYFNHTKKIGDDYAITEPGVYYRDFEKETLSHNLLLPSYPASREICTVGGMVGNNAGGELNLLYGKTENYINGLKMVLSDGNEYSFKPLDKEELDQKIKTSGIEGDIYTKLFNLIDNNYDLIKQAKPNVSKNSAGYYLWNVYNKENQIFDPTKLIVGSQGTFGIITEINFKLVKPKQKEHLLVIFLNDLRLLPDITNHLLKLNPQSIESYDDQTFKVAMRLLPDILKRLGGNALKLFFNFLPESWMVLTGGIPKLVLLAEFSSDSEQDALARTKEAQESLRRFKIKTKLIKNRNNEAKYWVVRRESFNLLRHHVRGMRTAPFIDDFVVRPEKLGEFLPKLYKIMDKYKLLYTVAGHIGDGNFHIIPLMKVGDPNIPSVVKNLSEEVYQLVFDYQGSITGEHNDGLIRSPYLERMYGHEVYEFFVETKKIFDPNNIFNPGKKVGATTEFAMDHIQKG